MPCFLAGENQAKVIAPLLDTEAQFFSHQEGHLEAARRFTGLKNKEKFVFFHFSGVTTEILRYNHGKIEIMGESEDISFGQLLDRIGDKRGFRFPAGEMMDRIAHSFNAQGEYRNMLPKIKVDGLKFNLSGIETAAGKLVDEIPKEELAYMLFERILECIKKIVMNSCEESGLKDVLFSGGVSSSEFIREGMKGFDECNIYFADPGLSSDNAIGIAFLGGDKFWQENR